MPMLLGLQVSSEGKIYESIGRAAALGCNAMQIFARNPQQWRHGRLSREDIEEFRRRRKEARIKLVFVHIPYLINLASPEPGLYGASIDAYIEDILEADALGADYIVTHMGSHKDTTEEAGLERLGRALDRILEKSSAASIGVLLENTAGSGSWLGYTFEHQRTVIQALKDKERVGLCLDTAHAYLAGYDLATKDGLDETLQEIDRLVGVGLVKLVHLNDAKGALGSRHDRHDHIGKGGIGLAGMKNIVNHPRLRNAAFILETPKKNEGDDAMNLAAVRRLRKK